MAVRLLSLRGIPDDEVEDIRRLLIEQRIDFYETPEGNWGISMPAIWLHDEGQLDAAKQHLSDYHIKRQQQAKEVYEQQKSADEHTTLWRLFKTNPLRFILYIAMALVIAYFSIMPFLEMGQG